MYEFPQYLILLIKKPTVTYRLTHTNAPVSTLMLQLGLLN